MVVLSHGEIKEVCFYIMISDRIRQIRNEFGLSQAEFGVRLGVSRDVIHNLELNRLKRPGQKTPLYKLMCRQFGVSELWLQTGEGQMFDNSTQFNNPSPQQELERALAQKQYKVKEALAQKQYQVEEALTQKIDTTTSQVDNFKDNMISALSLLDKNDWTILITKAIDLANYHENQLTLRQEIKLLRKEIEDIKNENKT